MLEVVVEHNEVRECLHRKRRAFEAWRQVVEVLLCTVPQDLLSGERRQAVLFEFLQELLIKVCLKIYVVGINILLVLPQVSCHMM